MPGDGGSGGATFLFVDLSEFDLKNRIFENACLFLFVLLCLQGGTVVSQEFNVFGNDDIQNLSRQLGTAEFLESLKWSQDQKEQIAENCSEFRSVLIGLRAGQASPSQYLAAQTILVRNVLRGSWTLVSESC